MDKRELEDAKKDAKKAITEISKGKKVEENKAKLERFRRDVNTRKKDNSKSSTRRNLLQR